MQGGPRACARGPHTEISLYVGLRDGESMLNSWVS